MAQFDLLDKVLSNELLTNDDWGQLAEILGIKEIPKSKADRRKIFNKEIRHSYGDTLINVFRDEYSPDYLEIVTNVAKKLAVSYKEHHSIEEIEDRILIEVFEIIKDRIIKDKGITVWEKIEKDIEEEIKKLITDGAFSQDVANVIGKLKGAAIITAIVQGKMTGSALYIVVNKIFVVFARRGGLGTGVAVGGPIVGMALAFYLGLARYALLPSLISLELGNTNWGKVIPAVVMIAVYRKKINFMWETNCNTKVIYSK